MSGHPSGYSMRVIFISICNATTSREDAVLAGACHGLGDSNSYRLVLGENSKVTFGLHGAVL